MEKSILKSLSDNVEKTMIRYVMYKSIICLIIIPEYISDMNISLQLISYQDWMIGERSRFVGELDTDGDGHLNDDEVIPLI